MTKAERDSVSSGLKVTTGLGSFTIELAASHAPRTCSYFADLATRGRLDDGAIFRITAVGNRPANVHHPIHVIQLGTRNGLNESRDRIVHEDTDASGLRHTRFTVSAARFEPGELYASFFVCLRDEPALDAGGGRRSDGKGYAAFGSIVDGRDVIESIYQRADTSELLETPIAIERVDVVPLDAEPQKEETST
ncbi:MAG: peptidylprolyl isomerase [Pseudomonadota bacterium]